MRSCAAKYVGDTLDDERMWIVTERSNTPDDAPAIVLDRQAHNAIFSGCMPGCAIGMSLHSLRDERGLPHLTFFALEGWGAWAVDGYRNASPVKLSYRQRLEKWALDTRTILADSFDKAHDAIRARPQPDERLDALDADPRALVEMTLKAALTKVNDDETVARCCRYAWDAYVAIWDTIMVDRAQDAIEKDSGRSPENQAQVKALFDRRVQRNQAAFKDAYGKLCQLTFDLIAAA
jgi:hypothetical protein